MILGDLIARCILAALMSARSAYALLADPTAVSDLTAVADPTVVADLTAFRSILADLTAFRSILADPIVQCVCFCLYYSLEGRILF